MSVNIIGYSWNKQYAVDDQGNQWVFDELYDLEDDLIVFDGTPIALEDCSGAMAMLKVEGKPVYCNIMFSDFTSQGLNS